MAVRVFIEKGYNKDRKKSQITDTQLYLLAEDVIANPHRGALGGGVYKRRIELSSGTSGGARTIIFYHHDNNVFYYDGWEKNQVGQSGQEIPPDLLSAYKIQSKVYKNQTVKQRTIDIKSKDLVEIILTKPENTDG
ncbi:type II toxin-antitoxin system RelE/ParE family toxin [Candidatus Pantoea multigeneris]|uniref:Type II toxin-antitoxin system RelE/ParE family toxin n=1 Tax=Candidatus Pantoea multigeneris TaxID=2608357 RepID=A0ABX0RE77_9GAMM|nr:type II toxin-antitoxin system RelE/ParE family toxin [Pantoea multigeneris]NIF23661.1 type II toxin-antitoxin system RelE/ParE family toxin [Pantoea multigeneris]